MIGRARPPAVAPGTASGSGHDQHHRQPCRSVRPHVHGDGVDRGERYRLVGNTATVAAPLGVTDTDAANNTATDTDTLTPRADLAMTKTDGRASVIPGKSTTYTMTSRNNGPRCVPGHRPSLDSRPAERPLHVWTCAPAPAAGCTTASGSGSINATVNLPTGTGHADPSPPVRRAATGSDQHRVHGARRRHRRPARGNNSATDTDTLTPTADLSITKTDGSLGDSRHAGQLHHHCLERRTIGCSRGHCRRRLAGTLTGTDVDMRRGRRRHLPRRRAAVRSTTPSTFRSAPTVDVHRQRDGDSGRHRQLGNTQRLLRRWVQRPGRRQQHGNR